MTRETRRERLLRQLNEQRKWIDDNGRTLAGYIRKYGDPGIPPLDEYGQPEMFAAPEDLGFEPVPGLPGNYYMPHFGDGGTAIYKADVGRLRGIEAELELIGGAS